MRRDQIVIAQGDITAETTDAIVNAANTELMLGAGVAGAIRRKGGPGIQKECDAVGPIPLGEAAITGGGNLKARFVIHAASMALGGPLTSAESLGASVRNSLLRAEEKGLKSVSFPAIGTGVAGFPVSECARIMLDEILHFAAGPSGLEVVRIVLFDEATYRVFRKEWEK